VVEWEGTVLRVDGFDEQIEYIKHKKVENDDKDAKEFDEAFEYSEDEVALTQQYSCQVYLRMSPRFKVDQKTELSHREPDLVLWLDHVHFNKN
tara:strand:+ start:1058 stop:1336 length:279 start_codon:yes stop_codon:yes gene_type:complete